MERTTFSAALPAAAASIGGDAPVAAAAAGPDAAYVAKATRAAIDFESFFIGHMLHQMRSGTRAIAPDDSVFKDEVNSDMQDMADTMLAGQMAHQRAFGIADAILRQLLPASTPNPTPNATAHTAPNAVPDSAANISAASLNVSG